MADPSQKSDPDDDMSGVVDSAKEALDRMKNAFNRAATGKSDASADKPVTQEDLFRAVKNNRKDIVLKLLEGGFDPDTYNTAGQTALHIAAINNAVDAAQVLIDFGANPLRGKKDDQEYVPLEDAIRYGKVEMVKMLARQGGYVPGATMNGLSLLHRACQKNNVQAAMALLEAGADGNEKTENGATPLLIAAKAGHLSMVKALLEFSGIAGGMNEFFVNTDEKKRTAFQIAVGSGKAEMAAVMIEKGAHVNGRDADGKSPLMYAIEAADVSLVKLLVRAGADLNETGVSYPTPLAYACHVQNIHTAVMAEIIDFLIRSGSDPEIATPRKKMTPLHILAARTDLSLLSALLKYPVNKEAFDASGHTPLMIVLQQGRSPDFIRKLVEAGADPDARHAEDAGTALIQAARSNSVSAVQELLKAGANPALYDFSGRSALSYAREAGARDISLLLEQSLRGRTPPSIAPRI